MMDLLAESTSAPSIVDGWQLSIGCPMYLVRCFLGVLGVRLILSLFKMFAMKLDDEHLRALEPEEARRDAADEWGWWKCYRAAFVGFGQNKGGARIDDHALGAIIGMCELAAYPILIFTNQIPIIGGWVAIKIAGQWGTLERVEKQLQPLPACQPTQHRNRVSLALAFRGRTAAWLIAQ